MSHVRRSFSQRHIHSFVILTCTLRRPFRAAFTHFSDITLFQVSFFLTFFQIPETLGGKNGGSRRAFTSPPSRPPQARCKEARGITELSIITEGLLLHLQSGDGPLEHRMGELGRLRKSERPVDRLGIIHVVHLVVGHHGPRP